MHQVDPNGIAYTGAGIVPELVATALTIFTPTEN
jgi:hypothetical protein